LTFVKICGLTAPEHLEAARAAGADFVGLIFAEQSRRRVTVEQAKRIVAALPARAEPALIALPLPTGHTGALWFERCAGALEALLERRRPLLVGLFADQPASLINSIAEVLGLDLVQLSGTEPWEDCLLLRRPVIKTERVAPGDTAPHVVARVEAGTASLLHLDTAVPGRLGGTGVTFDWQVARAVAERLPVMLAGGLSPANVTEAVVSVRPWAVDVSSGVETDGVKDGAKIAAFVRAVQDADVRLRARAAGTTEEGR
jgi:phosphoribosylanthranilate isomerase